MSRAFVSDKEDWAYCAKAGERCLHAGLGEDCRKKDCQHYAKAVQAVKKSSGDRTVRRTEPRAKTTGQPVKTAGKTPAKTAPAGQNPAGRTSPARSTKRANIKPPRRWGGRHG